MAQSRCAAGVITSWDDELRNIMWWRSGSQKTAKGISHNIPNDSAVRDMHHDLNLIWAARRRRCLSFHTKGVGGWGGRHKTLSIFSFTGTGVQLILHTELKKEESLAKAMTPSISYAATSCIFSRTLETAFLCLLSDRVYTLAMIMLWLPKYKDSLYCQLRNNKNGTKRGKFKLLQQLPVISIYWEGNRG